MIAVQGWTVFWTSDIQKSRNFLLDSKITKLGQLEDAEENRLLPLKMHCKAKGKTRDNNLFENRDESKCLFLAGGSMGSRRHRICWTEYDGEEG